MVHSLWGPLDGSRVPLVVRGGTGHLISAWKENGLHPQAWAQKESLTLWFLTEESQSFGETSGIQNLAKEKKEEYGQPRIYQTPVNPEGQDKRGSCSSLFPQG